MSKFKTMVRNDISFCEKLIMENYATSTQVKTLVGKYIIDYPQFNDGIISYLHVPGHETNEIDNIIIVKGKLEYLLNRIDNPELYSNKDKQLIPTIINSNINQNTNSNNNAITLNMSINNVRENITENTFLCDQEKQVLLEKLDEIIELQKSDESKSKKWNKAKGIISFLLDKGADVAIMYIPHILSAIRNI